MNLPIGRRLQLAAEPFDVHTKLATRLSHAGKRAPDGPPIDKIEMRANYHDEESITEQVELMSARAAVAMRPRRTKAEQRAESMEQILDAAEDLFSKHGYYGVTMRDVAERVGANTALLHYYFKDKASMFEACFARRAPVTIDLRMKALEEYEKTAGKHVTVEGALHAFLDTDLDLYHQGGEKWMNSARFCARVSNTPEGAEMMDEFFDPVVLRLVSVLKKALPDYSEEQIFWGYQFVTGALMTVLARTGRIDRLSGGVCHSDDFPTVKKYMAKFMAAGFLALKDDSPKKPAPKAAKTRKRSAR